MAATRSRRRCWPTSSGSCFLSRRSAIRRDPTVAVDELLRGTPRRRVDLRRAADFFEGAAELSVQLVVAVSNDVEPAALAGALRTERRHQYVPARLDRPPDRRDIAASLVVLPQE